MMINMQSQLIYLNLFLGKNMENFINIIALEAVDGSMMICFGDKYKKGYEWIDCIEFSASGTPLSHSNYVIEQLSSNDDFKEIIEDIENIIGCNVNITTERLDIDFNYNRQDLIDIITSL